MNSSISAEERSEILRLVADGKMTIDEAASLLSGVKEEKPPFEKSPAETHVQTSEELREEDTLLSGEFEAEKPFIPEMGNGKPPRWFHVDVSDSKTGKRKVRVNIPLKLVQFGLSVGRRFSPELSELDIDELSSLMGQEKGMLVDVQDEEDGERVLIYVD